METGMLWFDNSDKSLADKVKVAAQHFQKKYGRTPDLCLVNPGMMGTEDVVPFYGKEIHVRPYRSVLPGHLWIGLDDVPEYVEGSKAPKATEVAKAPEASYVSEALR